MLVAADRETLRWIQKTLSRARRNGRWSALIRREACWTPEVFAALVDEHDRLQLEGCHEVAAEIGRQLPLLAEWIRPQLCPGHDLGKRSLEAWALAILGSSLRAAGRPQEAGSAFAQAFAKTAKGVHRWAQAELERRYAFHLLQLGDRRAFELVDRALAGFGAEHPDQAAECLNLRGACHTLFGAPSGAVQDYGAAAALSDPGRSERSGWTLQASLHNLALQLVRGGPCSLESLSQARRMLLRSRAFLGKGLDSRKLASLWVEGLLVYRIGWNRHGERLLERARQGFLKLGSGDEYRLATIDLAVMLADDGEAERASELLRSLPPAAGGVPLELGGLEPERANLVEGLRRRVPRADSRRVPRAPN